MLTHSTFLAPISLDLYEPLNEDAFRIHRSPIVVKPRFRGSLLKTPPSAICSAFPEHPPRDDSAHRVLDSVEWSSTGRSQISLFKFKYTMIVALTMLFCQAFGATDPFAAAGLWQCTSQCGFYNNLSHRGAVAETCGARRRGCHGVRPIPQWPCNECTVVNRPGTRDCHVCGNHFEFSDYPELAFGIKCNRTPVAQGRHHAFGGSKTPAAHGRSSPPPKAIQKLWTCKECTVRNPFDVPNCKGCNKENPSSCAICFDHIDQTDTGSYIRWPCADAFHTKCADQWLARSGNHPGRPHGKTPCPLCRTSFDRKLTT